MKELSHFHDNAVALIVFVKKISLFLVFKHTFKNAKFLQPSPLKPFSNESHFFAFDFLHTNTTLNNHMYSTGMM